MKSKFLILGIAASLLSASALAFVAQEFTLKFKHEKGAISKYKLAATIEAPGQSIGVTATVVEKTTKVDDDGGFTMESGQEGLKLSVGGQEMEPGSQEASTEVRNAKGEILEIKGAEAETSMRTGVLNNFVLPGKAIKVGDTWEYAVKKDEKKGTVSAKVTFKLLSEDKVGTHDCLKVKITGIESEGSMPATMDTTAWIEKDGLKMIKAESKWTNVPIPGAGAVNGTVKLDLIG